MIEGSETPGDPPRRSEGDLLAERRARRAAESGDAALARRAEAAEATVRTLETHVASLQQRLGEVEQQRGQLSERIDAEQEQPATDRAAAGESELRRVKQREYAEQQLRVEAEDRYLALDRESRAQIDRLGRRLATSEREARDLASRLHSVQRELAEAEQAAAAERGALRATELELGARLAELERRAIEIHRGLEAERAARERSERLLEGMREGHRRVESLARELRPLVARMRAVASAPPAGPSAATREPPLSSEQLRAPTREPPLGPGLQAPDAPQEARRAEMAEALAAAVERLRARVETIGEPLGSAEELPVGPNAAPPTGTRAPADRRPAHKHSMSLLTRLRIRRKDRRERRSAAAEPPSMQSQ